MQKAAAEEEPQKGLDTEPEEEAPATQDEPPQKKHKGLDTEPEEEAPAPQEDPPIVIQDIDEVSDDSDWGPWTKYDKPDSDLTWLELADSEDSD